MTLDDLISQTRTHARNPEPLQLLASAAHRRHELATLGEQLLSHFVQEARGAGCSWSQIGTTLGVSKQAAQQRHSADVSARVVRDSIRYAEKQGTHLAEASGHVVRPGFGVVDRGVEH
ncbi:MAG: hypothetical protein WCF33_17195 [Pseudonocardiaceae bacterium]